MNILHSIDMAILFLGLVSRFFFIGRLSGE